MRLRVQAKVAAVLLTLLCYSVGIFDHDLWLPDEFREAEIAREIGEFHSPFVPTLVGEPFVEKPPLSLWCVKASYFMLGSTSGAARIPSALFALGAGMFALLLARRTSAGSGGFEAFILTCFSLAFLDAGHRVQSDASLAFAVSGALWGLQIASYPERPSDTRNGWFAFYGFCALGFWCKGFIGIVFPLLAWAGVTLVEKRFRELFRLRHLAGISALVVCAGLWLFFLWREDPTGELVRTVVIENHLERFLPGPDYHLGHENKPLFFYARSFLYFLPGLLFLFPSLVLLRRERAPRREWLVPAAALVLGLLFLTLSGTKRSIYFLPLYVPLALLTAPWLVRAFESNNRRWPWLIRIAAVAYIATMIGAPLGRLLLPWLADALPRDGRLVFLDLVSLPKTIYLPALALLIVGLVAAAAFAAFSRSPDRTRSAWGFALIVLVSYPCVFGSFVGINNDLRSFRPMAEAIERQVPLAAPFLDFYPEESTCGIIPFYTGRYPERIPDSSAMFERLAAGQRSYAVFSLRRRPWGAPWRVGELVPVREIARVVGDTNWDKGGQELQNWQGRLLYFHHNGTRRWHFLFVIDPS